MRGIIFNIDEFAVHDGPGIRTAVYFKGCPLRCAWCHSPEGLSPTRQIQRNVNQCIRCGACENVCSTPEQCVFCRVCIVRCEKDCLSICGTEYEVEDIVARIKRNSNAFALTGGGVTLTGGEVLMQPDFLLVMLKSLHPLHRTVETCGYGEPVVFSEMLKHVELVYFDLKIMDESAHIKYTGRSNAVILENATTLIKSGIPFIIRIPFIRNVNDSEDNIRATARFLQSVGKKYDRGTVLVSYVELLPYNKMAGAKHASLGLSYTNTFDEADDISIERAIKIFTEHGLRCEMRET